MMESPSKKRKVSETRSRDLSAPQSSVTIPKSAVLSISYVIKQLQDARSNPEKIDEFIDRITKQYVNKKRRPAADMRMSELQLLFQIREKRDLVFSPEEYLIHEVPEELLKYYARLDSSGWDCEREQSSRIRADLLLIPAMDQARLNQQVPFSKPPGDYRKDLIMHHEYDIHVEVQEPDNPETTWFISGRADWAFGHSGRDTPSSLLLCIEAKSEANFGQSEVQLSTYLAICQHQRKIAQKAVPLVRGFSTDGRRYSFQRLDPDGLLHRSPTYDIARNDLRLIYNVVIHHIESAINLSPTTTPVKGSSAHRRKTSTDYAKENFRIATPPIRFAGPDDEILDPLDLL